MTQRRGNGRKLRQRNPWRRRRPLGPIESLEERRLLAVLVVSNTSDTGPGSLREAILQSNTSAEKDQVVFAIPGVSPKIALDTPLPEILNPVVVDGSTQPGYIGRPVVQIDGTKLSNGVHAAFSLQAGDSTVRGLALTNFGHAIFVTGLGNNTIEGNFLGLSPSEAEEGGNTYTGVFIVDSSNNTIGGHTPLSRNVISGSGQYGIRINGLLAQDNRIQGNYIGTNAAGTAAVPNAIDGILLSEGPHHTLIGTDGDGIDDAAERNVVSGNARSGVQLYGSAQNVIAGNFLGTNADGSAAIPNGDHGLVLVGAASANRIGTDGNGIADVVERNVISGNIRSGIAIFEAASNVVAGNFIGTSFSGLAPLKNGKEGILLTNGALQNLIGTDGDGVGDSSEGNLISGNGTNGITIWNSHQNTVAGNLIGLSLTGNAALPNEHSGLWITFGSTQNVIGTNDDGVNDVAERNIISGNLREGIAIQQASANRVTGNYIGTNRDGTAQFGNANGIWICAAAANVIGTDADSRVGSSAGNVISGGRTNGIIIFSAGASGNKVGGNLIGLSADGNQALPNALSGIVITSSADSNAIGGGRSEQRNTISRNGKYGIELAGRSHGTTILGNRIGLNAAGTNPLGNALAGIAINNAYDNSVGSDTAEAANDIAFNGPRGVVIETETAMNNRIERNSIYGHSLIGVDLGTDGATPNDASDLDSGPNALQNYPNIQFVASAANKTQVTGSLVAEAGITYLLRFYSKYGDGNLIEDMEYLGSTEIVSRTAGEMNWLAELPVSVAADRTVIATARHSRSGTSEFSPPSEVLELLPVSLQVNQITEGATSSQASISRGAIPIDRALVVTLSSSDPQRASVPAQIEIPAGLATANFLVTIVDDSSYEDIQSIVISARLQGEAAGAASFILVDDESAWYNYASPMDVNGDGSISPLDALIVINALNQLGSMPLSSLSQPSDGSKMYVDTNLDGFLSPIDALLVINYLNVAATGSEGEAASSESPEPSLDSASVDEVFFDLDARLRKLWV